MRTEEEIHEQIEIAEQKSENGTGFFRMTYEEGVIAALDWILGVTRNKPMDILPENNIISFQQYKNALNVLKKYSDQVRKEYLIGKGKDLFLERRNGFEFSKIDLSKRTRTGIIKYLEKDESEITLNDFWEFNIKEFGKVENVGKKSAHELATALAHYNIPFTGITKLKINTDVRYEYLYGSKSSKML